MGSNKMATGRADISNEQMGNNPCPFYLICSNDTRIINHPSLKVCGGLEGNFEDCSAYLYHKSEKVTDPKTGRQVNIWTLPERTRQL
jgi:hypothetical protein